MSQWTRKPKPVPKHPPSDWQWFWHDKEDEPTIQELWPDRKHWPDGWWWDGPLHPRPPKPPKKEKNK